VRGAPALGSGTVDMSVWADGVPLIFAGTEGPLLFDLISIAEARGVIEQIADEISITEAYVTMDFYPKDLVMQDEIYMLIDSGMVGPAVVGRFQRVAKSFVELES